MGISIDPSLPARDWSGMVKPSLEAIAKLIAKDYFGTAFKAHEASKGFRRKEETREQRVWTLWRESLTIALPEFFVTAALARQPDDEELGRLLVDILEESEAVAKADREGLTEVHFRTPTSFPLYPPFREKLPAWARTVAPEHLRDDERLKERLDRAFERGFRRAFADRSEHFAPLRDFFAGDEAETEGQRDAWRRYYGGLNKKIEEEPLFNQPEDGSGATLGAIFQPLRCYWRIRPKRDRQDEPDNGAKPDEVHVAWLQTALETWLGQRNGRDALRVVTGGPGSGKSSSAYWFARDVALAGSFNVFVMPLQGLDVDRQIDEIVDTYVRLAGTDHSMLEASPIQLLRDDPKPLLLIFDGLDEVARPDGAGLEVTKTFLRTLDSRLSLANGGKGPRQARLMALALGRPQAAEEAALAMGGLADKALLHVAPLSPLDEDFFTRNRQRDVTMHDPAGLAGEDFRATFYERYRPFDDHYDGDGTPEALKDDGLAEMTVEPLLLYLLIVSGYAGKDWPLARDNRNRVYERIFRDIHRRDLEKPVEHPSKMGIGEEADFFALMECLGLAAWLGGGRSGSDEDFATIRDRVYVTKRGGRFKGKKSADLKNVAVQAFTHRGDGDDPGYAFIHKSFGEYLTARALVEAGDKWLLRHDGEADDFAADWLQLAGGERLTSEVLHFMMAETRLRANGLDDARERIKTLSAIAGHTVQHGFPANEKLITLKGIVDWRQREIFQRNTEEACEPACKIDPLIGGIGAQF
ncbi:MAG: NACHT domain-containing protein [Geminicoccaceae bacterium]